MLVSPAPDPRALAHIETVECAVVVRYGRCAAQAAWWTRSSQSTASLERCAMTPSGETRHANHAAPSSTGACFAR
eukprot:2807947-Pleurochrysis_carterae.AAC.4